ncbi:unnamed protein product [Brassica oleracea var. botrytis]|uniref:(rape) hypothetical protein n=1 Tax=Brassica napus TaxID=3708 RepID=A0A816J6L3_BRANA|nr:unnamed protein product [Brassica napus]
MILFHKYLIQLDRDGLKKDIREGLESTEFATLRALFQEASEIEEILEMEKTPPTTPRGRPLTAYNAKAGCGSVTKSSAAEQVSVSGTTSESSDAQGSVCASNVMAAGGFVGDSSSVTGSNSAQGSSRAQGSVSRAN